jgi:hypothetical protein
VKRIIDGETYETARSTVIAEARYGGASDKDTYKEALYRNNHGRFFLAAEGGVETYYASLFHGGKETPGTDIIPLTASEARRWLEDQDHIEEIERLFGKQPDAGQDKVCIDLWIPADTKLRIELAAAAEHVSVISWLTRAVERELDFTESQHSS